MRGVLSIERFLWVMLIIVEMKLIAPMIDEIPAIWREKIAKSTEAPLWKILEDKGGYTVQPVPAPELINLLKVSSIIDGGKSQNLMLFIRG